MVERAYESIEVNAPVERVYEYWQNLENLPQFMTYIEEVRSTGPDTTHWRVKGPLGAEVEFDARTTQDRPNRAIRWDGAEGDIVVPYGRVRLEELGPERTRVFVSLDFSDPPGGRLGEVALRAVANPKLMMQQDLQNFKEIIEGTAAPEEVRRRPAPARPRTGGDGPNLGALRLLDEWMADDSGYDEEVLPELKEALDRDRPSYRKLFG